MKSEGKGELKPGEVAVLAELVAYQPGAIVSRTLLDNKGGSVTLFAFDAGQNLSAHTAPFDAMVCVLDGKAEIVIARRANRVKTGQVIVMPANVAHAVRAPERFKMMLVMIKA